MLLEFRERVIKLKKCVDVFRVFVKYYLEKEKRLQLINLRPLVGGYR